MTTGTIKLKAEFPNVDKALWPGQFVNVVMTLYDQKDAIVVPSAAVQNGPNGQYVYVVKPDMTVEVRNIKVDAHRGRRDDRRQRPEAGRAGRHRRPAAARARHAGQRRQAEREPS